jgi:hypothetical protein
LAMRGERGWRTARRTFADGDGVRAGTDLDALFLEAAAMRDDLRGEKGSQESAKPRRGVGGV